MGCAKSKPERNQPRVNHVQPRYNESVRNQPPVNYVQPRYNEPVRNQPPVNYVQLRYNEPVRNRLQQNNASVRYDNVPKPRGVRHFAAVETEAKLAYRGSRAQSLRRSFTSANEKCYDSRDKTLKFVDGDDDLDFLCEGFKSPRAKMSCGHAVTPMSLTNWCRRLLDEGECRFVCGQTNCNVEWTYEEVCKMALLTPRETEYFEKKMFNNAAKDYLDIKVCPGCRCRVVRTDPNNLCVECSVCTAEKYRTFMFCWQCLKEWKGPAPRSDGCENKGCFNQALETLRKCPNINFKDVEGVTGCPSIRACPTCGFLVEHNRTQCKTIVCPRCKVKFCFVCLKLPAQCPNPYKLCFSGVAPRQVAIPVWHQK